MYRSPLPFNILDCAAKINGYVPFISENVVFTVTYLVSGICPDNSDQSQQTKQGCEQFRTLTGI